MIKSNLNCLKLVALMLLLSKCRSWYYALTNNLDITYNNLDSIGYNIDANKRPKEEYFMQPFVEQE